MSMRRENRPTPDDTEHEGALADESTWAFPEINAI